MNTSAKYVKTRLQLSEYPSQHGPHCYSNPACQPSPTSCLTACHNSIDHAPRRCEHPATCSSLDMCGRSMGKQDSSDVGIANGVHLMHSRISQTPRPNTFSQCSALLYVALCSQSGSGW
jgi:hypothetical protein